MTIIPTNNIKDIIKSIYTSKNTDLSILRFLQAEKSFWEGKGIVIIFAIIFFVIVIIAAIIITLKGGKKQPTKNLDKAWDQNYNNNPVQQHANSMNQNQQYNNYNNNQQYQYQEQNSRDQNQYATDQAIQGNNLNHFSRNNEQVAHSQQHNNSQYFDYNPNDSSTQNINYQNIGPNSTFVEYKMEDQMNYSQDQNLVGADVNQYSSMVQGGVNSVSFLLRITFLILKRLIKDLVNNNMTHTQIIKGLKMHKITTTHTRTANT